MYKIVYQCATYHMVDGVLGRTFVPRSVGLVVELARIRCLTKLRKVHKICK